MKTALTDHHRNWRNKNISNDYNGFKYIQEAQNTIDALADVKHTEDFFTRQNEDVPVVISRLKWDAANKSRLFDRIQQFWPTEDENVIFKFYLTVTLR